MCSDSIINRTVFTGYAGLWPMRNSLHSPNAGSVAMAIPTKGVGQGTSAWRVIHIFLFSHL